MRIKNCILLAFLCFGGSSVAKADVDAIRVRFGDTGTITDISTSLTSATMAVTSPIVEPDGTLTDPIVASLATEEETDALFLTAAADEETEDDNCTQAGGTGSNENCVCPDGGIYMLGNDNKYRCCKENKPYNVTLGAYSPNVLVPQCGCNALYAGIAIREPYIEGADKVCCYGKNRIWSANIGTESFAMELDETNCGCPVAGEGEPEIREVTSGSAFFCCQGSNYLQEKNSWQKSVTYCGCKDSTSDCTTKELCESAGYNWCGESVGCSLDECPLQCPEGTELKQIEEDVYICCKNGYEYTKGEDDWIPTYNPYACECPNGGAFDADEEVCCSSSYTWGGSAYNVIDARCGCPSGYTKSEDVCCSETERGTYASADEEVDISKAIRLCGCGSGETRYSTDIQGGYVCCDSNHQITHYTGDVMGEPTAEDMSKYCGCDEGEYSVTEGACVGCATNEYCTGKDATKPVCDTATHECVVCTSTSCDAEQICTTEGCKTCEQIDSTKPHYENGSCYECSTDADCAGRSDGKKVCDTSTKTCETCILYTSESDDKNKGCEDVTTTVNGEEVFQPYCVQKTSGPGCSECRSNSDCHENALDRMYCLRETGVCGSNCGEAGYNALTGECNCSGSTPVWDIYRKKCVTCYNSISGAWTDLGCNKAESLSGMASFSTTDKKSSSSAANYSPYQSPKEAGKPVCYEEGAGGLGVCVECTDASECEGQKICKSDHTCACATGTTFQASTGRCVACTANNGASSGTKCGELKPYCDNGECSCNANYDSSKKDGDGKCPAKAPICDDGVCKCTKNYKDGDNACPSNLPWCDTSDNVCKACPSGEHYDNDQKKCVQCGANSSYNSSTKKCDCAAGYGVIGSEKKCTAANLPTSKKCNELCGRSGSGSCGVQVFSFTTVQNMKYNISFSGDAVDDGVIISCGGTTKYYCADHACTSGSTSSCSNGAATKMCASANWTNITGNGGTCTMTIQNQHGECTKCACGSGSSGNGNRVATVSASTTSYSP